MKILLATVVLVVLGTSAQAGAPQAPVHRVSPPSRYWLSEDFNRFVFWQVRAPARSATTPDVASQ